MESQSVHGLGIIKVFFRPGTNVQGAIAQITAICQTTVRQLPPGTTPPLIISYSASTTPIIQLGLSSKTLPEQQLFDLGQNFLRTFLATVPGAATPYPYGGKLRQIQVDLDLPKRRLSLYKKQSGSTAAPDWSGPYTEIETGRSRSGRLFFPLLLDDHRIVAFVDTGAQRTTLSLTAARALGLTDAALARDRSITLHGAATEQLTARLHRFGQRNGAIRHSRRTGPWHLDWSNQQYDRGRDGSVRYLS